MINDSHFHLLAPKESGTKHVLCLKSANSYRFVVAVFFFLVLGSADCRHVESASGQAVREIGPTGCSVYQHTRRQ